MCQRKEHVENGKVQEHHTDFEEALYLTGTGKYHYMLLLICGIGLMGTMMETFGISFLLPSAQCDFNFTSNDKGLLNALYPIGMICGSHTWGYLADTKGRKTVLVAAMLSDGFVALVSSFVHELWLLKAFRFVCGFITVGSASVMYAYFGEFHSSATRNSGLMWLSVFIGLGIGVQPGIAWLIIPQSWEWYLPWCIYRPWRLFITICALPNIIAGIAMLFFLSETPKFLISQGKDEESLKVLKYMYATNTGSSPDKYPVKSVVLVEDNPTEVASSGTGFLHLFVHMWNQTVPLLKPPFLWRTFIACFVQFGLYASANGISMWLPEIFNREASYFTLHPESEATLCQVFQAPKVAIHSLSNSSTHFNPASVNLKENDTLIFNCENNNLIMNVNNHTDIIIKANTNFLNCQEYLYNLSGNPLQIDAQNEEIVFTILNASTINYLSQYKTTMESSTNDLLINNEPECDRSVDLSAFQNTLIIGMVSAVCYVLIGIIITRVGKRVIIVCCLVSGGICGIFLDYVPAKWQFFAITLAFVNLSGMCITVMVSAVVELFPTNFRAMAVCLSLMCGRVGSFTANLLMGVLLETNCIIMTYLLGGICACCGLMCLFLPSPKKLQNFDK